jgi:hypothetical protein
LVRRIGILSGDCAAADYSASFRSLAAYVTDLPTVRRSVDSFFDDRFVQLLFGIPLFGSMTVLSLWSPNLAPAHAEVGGKLTAVFC